MIRMFDGLRASICAVVCMLVLICLVLAVPAARANGPSGEKAAVVHASPSSSAVARDPAATFALFTCIVPAASQDSPTPVSVFDPPAEKTFNGASSRSNLTVPYNQARPPYWPSFVRSVSVGDILEISFRFA